MTDRAPRRGESAVSPLAQITSRLGQVLDMACVVVGEPASAGRLRVRSGQSRGRKLTGVEFDADLAPCAFVMREGSFEISEGGTKRWPDSPIPCESYFGLVLQEGGEPVGHLAVSDFSPRTLTPGERALMAAYALAVESELRRERSEREGAPFVRILSESLPGAAYSYTNLPDGSRVVHYLSPKATEILGLEGAEMLATGLEHGRVLIHPEDRAAFARAVDESLELSQPLDVEHRMLTQNGDYRWFRSLARGSRLEDGSVRWAGIFLDSHQSHLLEEQFRALAENIPGIVNAYWQYPDGHRELVYASGGLEELLGHDRAEALGRDVDRFFEEIVHPDDRPGLFEAARIALQRGETLDHDYRILGDGDREHWVRTISHGLPAADGAVLWQGILIDVTDRREAELRSIEYRGALMAANEALHQEKRRTETGAGRALALIASLASRILETLAATREHARHLASAAAESDRSERHGRELVAETREAARLLEQLQELAQAGSSVDALERAVRIAQRRTDQDPGESS